MEIDTESSDKQKKLYFMTENLKEFHSKLSYEVQSKIPLEDLSRLANILVEDENIFEIIKGLKDCQNATERILKQQRNDQVSVHEKEIEEYTKVLNETELAHTVSLARVQHEKKMREIDKLIIQQLDDSVREQQQTLFALKVPGFHESMDTKVITIQMHLFSFLLRLQKLLEAQK